MKSWLTEGKRREQALFTAGAILIFKGDHQPVWPDASATGQVSDCCS